MKNYILYATVAVLSLFSCRENREDEFRPRTTTNEWIISTLKSEYLWYEKINENASKYAEPDIFFTNIITSSDSFSFIDIEGNTQRLNETNSSYGFEYYTKSVDNKALAARILLVYKNSPASKAGLKRGDWITAVNGTILTDKNISILESGEATTFTLSQRSPKNNEQSSSSDNTEYTWETIGTKEIEASTTQSYSPFYYDTIYNINNKQIAYIMFNKTNNDYNVSELKSEADAILKKIPKSCELILDIRYNNKNDIDLINEIASHLVPQIHNDDIFLIKGHNANNIQNDSIIKFKPITTDLELPRLYFITSNKTALEAEALIRGIKPYIETITIGQNTAGENAILKPYVCPMYEQYVIYPVIAAYYSSDEEINNFSSIQVDLEVNETNDSINSYYDIGNTNELLLKSTIDAIINGIPQNEND